MLHGITRWCTDCATRTIYLPVTRWESESGPDSWCCTACDAAVVLPSVFAPARAA